MDVRIAVIAQVITARRRHGYVGQVALRRDEPAPPVGLRARAGPPRLPASDRLPLLVTTALVRASLRGIATLASGVRRAPEAQGRGTTVLLSSIAAGDWDDDGVEPGGVPAVSPS
jgi:hypothetical protein